MIRTILIIPTLILLFLMSLSPVYAQHKTIRESFQLPNVSQKVVIDGNIDEKVWEQALVIELDVETKPGENVKPPVSTTAYLMEDGENLYVAFKAFDHNPSEIRAHYHDHDYIFDDDTVGIKLDPQNDDLYAYQFFVNALGVKHDSIEDGTMQNDNLSWNAIWDAAAKITKHGFQAELSIPLRVMRFEDSKPVKEWAFDLLRFYPRDNFHRISHHVVDRNVSCVLCQNARFTGLKDVDTGNNLELVPFITATQYQSRPEPIVDRWDNSGVDADYGIDIRWGVTADTTLNATINPDFSQVESDVAKLDINNTFSLFYPVTHSSNNNNYAAFFTNDNQTNYILPGNTSSDIASYDAKSINGVVRYRRDLANSSSVGTMVTMRKADNYHNYVYGVDGVYRLSNTETIRAQVLGSDSEDPQSVIDAFSLNHSESDGNAFDLHYKFKDRDWILWGRYTRLEKGFRADLGYQPRADYNRATAGFRHFWYEESGHWWNTISAGIDTRYIHDLSGQLLKKKLQGTLQYSGTKQSAVELEIETGQEFWNGWLYDLNKVELKAEFTAIPGLMVNLFASSEETIDFSNSRPGDQIKLSPRITWNLGLHFQTQLRLTKQIMDVSGGELFNTNLLDARFIYQFSAQSFLRLIVQYNDTRKNQDLYLDNIDEHEKDLGTQLLYSYKINPQTVFFLGYSDASYRDDTLNKLEKTDKTLFLKMSYSWLY